MRIRFALIAFLAVAGCVPPVPPAPEVPVTLRPYGSGALSWSIGLDAVETSEIEPVTPDGPPKPGDVCRNCRGTGRVGDGTVMVTCQACGGTGKVPANEPGPSFTPDQPEQPEAPEQPDQPEASEQPPAAPTYAPAPRRRIRIFR